MNFDYSDEQNLLRESISRFVNDNYELEKRRKLAESDLGWSREYWKQMAELGWLGMAFPEADGGFGGSVVDTMVMMEEFGKGLTLEPFYSTVVLAGAVLRHGASAEQKAALVPGIIDGSLLATVAYAEEQSRYDLHDVVTSAREDGGAWVLNGRKSVVLHAATADRIIVSARTSGGQMDRDGITLFAVAGDAEGLSREDYPTVDGLRASEVTLQDVKVTPDGVIGEVGQGLAILEAMEQEAILALGAEAVGCMEMLYKDTIAYTGEREQFDGPLWNFQVLRHRMVEMFVEYELCKSILLRATMEAEDDPAKAARTVSALKYHVGKSGEFISQNAVQLHGGMGMTEELRIGHYFKRLMVIENSFGNRDHHMAKFTALAA
jgi:alkylation response protein AidB-like acyl-CoA dehydrogenase